MITQSLMYGNKTFAEIGVASIWIQRGIGHARVRVVVTLSPYQAYSMLAANERPWEVRLGGWLSLGHAQNHLCELTPVIHLWPRHEHPRPESEDLYGVVTFRELELVHEQRPPAEAPLSFTANIQATTFGSAGSSMGGRLELPYQLPVSEWRRQLDSCGYTKYFTIEIPVDGQAVLPMLQPAAVKLQQALEHRTAGRWREAVGACREVFEVIEGLFRGEEPPVGWNQLGQRETREALSLAGRIRLMGMAVRHSTHLAHHNSDSGGHVSREDATYIVDATCSAFRYYNERLR